jgi:hypothetical protein
VLDFVASSGPLLRRWERDGASPHGEAAAAPSIIKRSQDKSSEPKTSWMSAMFCAALCGFAGTLRHRSSEPEKSFAGEIILDEAIIIIILAVAGRFVSAHAGTS